MRSKFNESLPILEGPADRPEVKLGVCAMGDVAEGDQLTAMRVWIWQHAGTNVAAAAGTGGKHLGGHAMVDSERPPFSERWMVQTKLEPGSHQFVPEKPALALAMALVKHADGTEDVDHWSQAVMIKGHGGHEYSHG
jgi:hypothetical protein